MESLHHDAHLDLESPPGLIGRRRSEARRFLEVHASEQQFTARAVFVGLFVGTIVNFSNMYFGLQSK